MSRWLAVKVANVEGWLDSSDSDARVLRWFWTFVGFGGGLMASALWP